MPHAPPPKVHDPARLFALRHQALLDSPAEVLFDELTKLAARVLQTPIALISLVDADRQFFKSAVGLPEPWATRRETPLTHSFCMHAVESGEPLVITDARQHPLVHDSLAIPDLGAIAYAGIPLRSRNGHALGTLCVIDHRPRRWSQEEILMLSRFAGCVQAAVDLRAAARQGEERYRLALGIASDAVITIDEQSRMLFVNPAAERIFGYSRSELLGQSLVMLMPEELREKHLAGFQRFSETGVRRFAWEAVELTGRHKSGRRFPIEVSFAEGENDGLRFFTGVVRLGGHPTHS
jgi:PAS domain S-box-containing protein